MPQIAKPEKVQGTQSAWRRDHPDPALLERFLLIQTSKEENPPIVRHLLAPCPQCYSVVRRVLYETGAPLAQLLLRVGMETEV